MINWLEKIKKLIPNKNYLQMGSNFKVFYFERGGSIKLAANGLRLAEGRAILTTVAAAAH
jgi:hypothetical protein